MSEALDAFEAWWGQVLIEDARLAGIVRRVALNAWLQALEWQMGTRTLITDLPTAASRPEKTSTHRPRRA